VAEEEKDQPKDEKPTREELDEKQASESTEDIKPADEKPMEIKKQSKLKAFLSTKKGKAITALLVLVVAAVVIFSIPATRYGTVGYFVKKDVQVSVIDSSTKKPVSDASVKLDNQTVKTSAKGEATFKSVPVGEYKIAIAKKYYEDVSSSYVVPILSSPKQVTANLQATGRQVEIRVANLITKAVLAKASIVVGGTSAITDDKGMATVVLPADKKTLGATVSLVGYNDKKVTIAVTEQTGKNNIVLTPEGKLFYLSNQSGTIDVLKANLDGSSSTVVVKGTGNEERGSTSLLAARDWRYLALSARRDTSQKAQLFIVDTKTGELKTVDQGDASFTLVGWSGHYFIYKVFRNGKEYWDAGREALKSYDADTGKLTTIDQSAGEGSNEENYRYEYFGTPYILEGKIVYSKTWTSGNWYLIEQIGKKSAIVSVNPDGSDLRRVKEFAPKHVISIEQRLYEPQEVSFRVVLDNSRNPSFYQYEDGTVDGVSNTDEKFYDFYPTYLVSPSGNKTFWYEYRDGKNTLFVGDKNGKNGAVITSLSDYSTYGWFSDGYLLLSKGGSELYIVPADKPLSSTNQPIKITNYFKPGTNYPGYGYGYGGI
jgi:hypothetical protein